MATESIDEAAVLLVGPDRDDPGDEAADRRPLEGSPWRVRRLGPDDALEALAAPDADVDCVVCEVNGGAASFLRECADRAPTVPVVYRPETAEAAALSDAIAAGIDRYVPPASRSDGNLREAVEGAISTSPSRREDRARARAFEAIFDDEHTYSALLEPDGTVLRANDRLRGTASGEEKPNADTALTGRSFIDLAWWADERARAAAGEALERARRGDVAHRELRAIVDGEERTLEVTARPVREGGAAVTSLVIEARDVTERVELESELRASEELHRVTLNNMTDTVLITDDEGRFTYVCPNVHFIFGYTDDEIHEMGTIDELLGADLYDRGSLEAEGVLTNLECTATDKAGEEHTLLVNVREVSIQGGTLLYSCRDVTKRKEREEALAALQRTARRLLYAETREEIATVVVEDAPEVLGVEASAAFVFDTDENALRPVAASATMEELHGPLPAFRASDDSLTGRSFVDGEVRFLDDVHEADALDNPATDVRSGAFLPLGQHGVFVAGSAAVGRFDEVRRELADLLAATAEAALDRVERESTLRERDRELQRRNEQLSDVNRTNEIIREIDRAIVRAETRAEIERAVCDRLTADDRFRFAWIGEPDPTGETLEARALGGEDLGYLEDAPLALGADGEGEPALEPACRALATGSMTVVGNVVDNLREEPWRREALSREFQSVVSVPLAYDEFTYGVLSVYADGPEAFDDRSLSVFEELGETIASAMGAVERKSALLSTAGTRIELEVADPSFVFTRLAATASCPVSFDGGVRRTDDGTSVFATVHDGRIEAVADAARELSGIDDAQVITDEGGGDGGTLSVRLARPFIASRLADHGVVLGRVEATPDGATMVLDVPVGVDPRRSVRIVENAFADVTLVSKESVDDANPRDLRSALLERLTDRQLEVVQVAYYGGFYESPRERTGEEIADALGISSAAFYKHNQRVQRALFTALFDDVGLPARATVG